MTPLRVMTVDDESLALRRLRLLLQTLPEVEHVGEASGCAEAHAKISELCPDAVLLDIKMRDGNGFDVVEAIADRANPPLIIFVTAFDQFAPRAFDNAVVDYLLKPSDPERVAMTCERLLARLKQKPDPMNELLAQLSQRLGAGGVKPREYLRWVQASVGANIRMIPTSDILFFRAEDKYTRVQTQGFEALIRTPIKALIDELDPDEFWQIHRSTVVRVDAVEQVSRNFRGNQIVHVKGSGEKLEVSRTFNHLFKQM